MRGGGSPRGIGGPGGARVNEDGAAKGMAGRVGSTVAWLGSGVADEPSIDGLMSAVRWCGSAKGDRGSGGFANGFSVSGECLYWSDGVGLGLGLGVGVALISSRGTALIFSWDWRATWLPRLLSFLCLDRLPDHRRLALRETSLMSDGDDCADSRAAFLRCRSTVSHRLRFSSIRRVSAASSFVGG